MLDFCGGLDAEEWDAPSAAAGWSVRDVVAHLTGGMKMLMTPAALQVMRTDRIERLNDTLVAESVSTSPEVSLARYATWSKRGVAVLRSVAGPGLRSIQVPIGELGRFPLGLIPAIYAYDWHTHLRHDIAAALGRPQPPTDDLRMRAVVGGMLAVLSQSHRKSLNWLEIPLGLTLDGPGGGTWRIEPLGRGRLRIEPGSYTGTTAQIAGRALEFPQWGTARTPWRECDISIDGDVEWGARFLDTLHIV